MKPATTTAIAAAGVWTMTPTKAAAAGLAGLSSIAVLGAVTDSQWLLYGTLLTGVSAFLLSLQKQRDLARNDAKVADAKLEATVASTRLADAGRTNAAAILYLQQQVARLEGENRQQFDLMLSGRLPSTPRPAAAVDVHVTNTKADPVAVAPAPPASRGEAAGGGGDGK